MTVWIQNPFDNLPCEGFRKQRFWLMSEAFAAAGHAVTFWTSDFSHATKARRRFVGKPESFADSPFALRMLPTLPYSLNVCLTRIRSHRAYARTWIEEARAVGAKERPDIIVASTPTLSAAIAALTLGREFGAKTVIDVMDAWPETFERLAPRGFRWIVRLLLRPQRQQALRLYREADVVTGVCERYRALTGRPDYYLAYHGVDLTSSPSVPRSTFPVPSSSPVPFSPVRLVYAGNLGRTYDLDTVLRAVAENPDFTLDIAGDWKGTVPERVTAHGYLGQEQLHELLASCDVGVIPMNEDSWVGVPYKLCDYAKAGLRVVSSLGGESSALLERYRCGTTYRSGDAASLASAVRQAMKLEPSAARQMAEREFDARKIYADYVAHVTR